MKPGLDCTMPGCGRWVPESELVTKNVRTADCSTCIAARQCPGRGLGADEAWPDDRDDDGWNGDAVPKPVLPGVAA